MKRIENTRKEKLVMSLAVLALFIGMAAAFLQGLNVYAADARTTVGTERMDGIVIDTEMTVIEDEQIPAAQIPANILPVWGYLFAVGSVAAGCGAYGFIKHVEKKA